MEQTPQVVPYTPLRLAHDVGLFELATVMLACVAILLAVAGVVAFFNFRHVARAQARTEAEKVAREVAEGEAVAYLQAEMPALLREYMELARNAGSDTMADEIALAQESGPSQ